MTDKIFKDMPIQDILTFAKIGYACYPIIQQIHSFEKPKEATNDKNTKTTSTNITIINTQK